MCLVNLTCVVQLCKSMGKIRYYCDYCDRSFLDDLEVRKKHLNGIQHIRQRKQYYNQFRDAKTILEEEGKAEQCKRFVFYNACPFGDNCKYSHYSNADFDNLRQQIADEEAAKVRAESVEAALEKIPSVQKINSWLAGCLKSGSTIKEGKQTFTDLINVVSVPTVLEGYTNLPPSLLPWDLNSCGSLEVNEWG